MVTSHFNIEQTVSQKVETTVKVSVKGADVGESHTDIPEESLEDPNRIGLVSGREAGRGKPVEEKVIGDQDNAKGVEEPENLSPRRNLEPNGPPDQNTVGEFGLFSVPEEQEPEEDEEESSKESRRNLVPASGEEGMDRDQSNLTKPPDKDEVKTIKDVNENPVVEEELLAGKAKVDDSDYDDDLPWAMYRNIERNERASDAEDEFSADDEGSFDGELNNLIIILTFFVLVCHCGSLSFTI